MARAVAAAAGLAAGTAPEGAAAASAPWPVHSQLLPRRHPSPRGSSGHYPPLDQAARPPLCCGPRPGPPPPVRGLGLDPPGGWIQDPESWAPEGHGGSEAAVPDLPPAGLQVWQASPGPNGVCWPPCWPPCCQGVFWSLVFKVSRAVPPAAGQGVGILLGGNRSFGATLSAMSLPVVACLFWLASAGWPEDPA